MQIDVERLQMELNAALWKAGLNPAEAVHGCCQDGRIDFAPNAPPQAKSIDAAVLAAHSPLPAPVQQPRLTYQAAGLTDAELLEALWQQVVEGRPQAALDLQARRKAIDAAEAKTAGAT